MAKTPNSIARTRAFHKKAKADFCKKLAETGLVKDALDAAQISRDTAYRWRKTDCGFAVAWAEALQEGQERRCDELEAEADRRGLEGVLEPVFYKGAVCGSIRRYSDDLLKFRIKKELPEYRETIRQEHSGPGGGPIDYRRMTIEEKVKLRDELKRRLGYDRGRGKPGPGAGAG